MTLKIENWYYLSCDLLKSGPHYEMNDFSSPKLDLPSCLVIMNREIPKIWFVEIFITHDFKTFCTVIEVRADQQCIIYKNKY